MPDACSSPQSEVSERAGEKASGPLRELAGRLDKALQRREARKLREQIARELAQIEANKKK